MKKKISYILLASMLVLQLGGCGREEDVNQTQGTQEPYVSGAEGSEDAGIEISMDPGGILDPSAVLSLGGKDNSMDAYTAAIRVPLQVETLGNALEGGGERVFLGASRAYYFKKHLLKTAAESWDELSFVTTEGEIGSESFDWEHRVWDIGPVFGTDHYITFDLEEQEGGEDYRYFFTERGENHEKLREFPLDFLGGSEADVIGSLSGFAVDQSGVAHLLRYAEDGLQYLLVSPEGETVAECVLERNAIRKLVPLYDGRVALLAIADGGEGMTLQYMDAEAGKPAALAAWEKWGNNPYYATLIDEETLLYADKEGVYRSGLSGENPELLYFWSNHGIITHEVPAMQADEEGRILLIYEDSEDYIYLCLEPATEEVEICEITMAVSDMERYQWAAVEFNKRYPSCHIELTEYGYGDTTLLTQLTAGKGPVLIDTSLVTNFNELERLWEPLDMVMGQLGVMEELLPSVMEMGGINGKLYSMVTNFSLQTLVVNDPDLKDWDYDVFMQCVEDSPEMESIFDINYGGNYGDYFIMNFLSHGLEDNYFLDAETGKMVFDSSKFRNALEAAKKYCIQYEVIPPVSSLLEGKVLCNKLDIYKPEHLALYRVCYGENANYIGYPTMDGGTHLMLVHDMLAIRRSATKEEKEAAAAFISMCLSYEGQVQAAKSLNFQLSVRRDVLEEQIASMSRGQQINAAGFGPVSLGDGLNIELDRKTLLDMIDTAKPAKYFPRELRAIMSEELDLYFSGDITEDMLISHLESRVGLYLGERN